MGYARATTDTTTALGRFFLFRTLGRAVAAGDMTETDAVFLARQTGVTAGQVAGNVDALRDAATSPATDAMWGLWAAAGTAR